MAAQFQVTGTNAKALFTLKLHRGEGMVLLAMNWRKGRPPDDFVGFAIEYREPGASKLFPLTNRINFLNADGTVNKEPQPTSTSPIQKFRWVHFPFRTEKLGGYTYRVTPVFMDAAGTLTTGQAQEAVVDLRRETYPDKLNVTFTRGFVLSQAFADHYAEFGALSTLIPAKADDGLKFTPTHKKADEALRWMGFEAREAILSVLDEALADPQAQVRVVAYELNEPRIVEKLEQLGPRLKAIIDDSDKHKSSKSAESQAAVRLGKSSPGNVKRQHMGALQHNKTIVVDGPKARAAVCGSTNLSWRGFFVQNNNAVILRTKAAVKHFSDAFESYWANVDDDVAAFGLTASAASSPLSVPEIVGAVGFSPYASKNAQLGLIAADLNTNATSSVLYSLAFLDQTTGPFRKAIEKVTKDPAIFVYGIADKDVGGLDVRLPNGNLAAVSPSALAENVPEPFKSEPKGGSGVRMHHKFVVIDFDKPTARVYLGSYNFSDAADSQNGENLLLFRNRRIAVAYAVEALRIFDHYHFRARQSQPGARKQLVLRRPPSGPGELPWWDEYYTDPQKVRDRELFA
jgi:phospholipase D-like protein